MKIRSYKKEDLDEILMLFYETVHSVNLKDYSLAEADAWAPKEPDRDRWSKNLEGQDTLVAEQDGKIVGFANWDREEYFDCLYVHKDFQGKGIASQLADEIESRAQCSRSAVLHVEASVTARPFFEKRGYTLKRQQQVERFGQKLTNFVMEKRVR